MANEVNVVPELIPISDLRLRQNEVLARLHKAPIVVTQRSKAAAVLVDVGLWNRMVERIELLDDSVEALQAQVDLLTGKDDVVRWQDALAELDAIPG